MCFNKEWSITFALTSFGVAGWVYSGKGIWKSLENWQLTRIALLFVFFALMECLQFFQYLVIGQCDNMVNKVLTFLGWLHIAWQPYFSNLGFSALDKKNQKKERDDVWKIVLRLSNVSAIFLALRAIVPLFIELDDSSLYIKTCTADDEVMCGPRTCTEMGVYHLKWMFYLVKPSYALPCVAAHFFFMFVAPILMGLHLATVILFLTGPAITSLFVKAHPAELAAIWCFFSIGEAIVTIATQYLAVRKAAKNLKVKDN